MSRSFSKSLKNILFFFFSSKNSMCGSMHYIQILFQKASTWWMLNYTWNRAVNYVNLWEIFFIFIFLDVFFYVFLWMVVMTVMSMKFSSTWIFFFIFIQSIFFLWWFWLLWGLPIDSYEAWYFVLWTEWTGTCMSYEITERRLIVCLFFEGWIKYIYGECAG